MPQNKDTSQIVIPVHYANQVITPLLAQEIEIDSLLLKLGINRLALKNPKSSITPWQMSVLMQHSAEALNDEFLGIFSHKTKPGFSAFMLRYMLDSDNLEAFIQQGSAFITQFLTPFNVFVHKTLKHVSIEF